MPKAKAKSPTKPVPIPPEVAASRVMQRNRVTHKSLPRFNRDMLVAWTPAYMHLWFTKKWEAANDGDKDALDDIGELCGLIAKRGGGPQLNINVGGQMAVAGGNGGGFDNFMRRWNEARKLGSALTVGAELPAADFRRLEAKGTG